MCANLFNFSQMHAATNHAIVIGGGMAGLLAARVLADYYESVTILDRDKLPAEPVSRAGVPQAYHAHNIGLRAHTIINELFPGIMDEMRSDGGCHPGHPHMVTIMGPLAPMDLPKIFADADELVATSRVLLEWHVRCRVSRFDNVTMLGGMEVRALSTTPDGKRVTGVQMRERGNDLHESTLHADLVVDASGRRSKAPEWLVALGFGAPHEETINSEISYASRFYKKPANFHNRWGSLAINGRAPDNPRFGAILPIENDGWHVTLGGVAGHSVPTDEEGFLAWARQLADLSLYEAIRDAEPLTPIRGARTPSSRLRHFEKMKRWPAGFIVTGDAICASNPIYSQGISMSALEAVALQGTLLRYGTQRGFEHKFQQAAARVVAAPWFMATVEDLRWREIELTGGRSVLFNRWNLRLLHSYSNLLLQQATVDPYIANLFYAIGNMIVRPRMFMHPAVVTRIMWGAMQRSWHSRSRPPTYHTLNNES